MINQAYIDELQLEKKVPDYLTQLQQEHMSVAFIYHALMARTLSFEDIQFLPKLSQNAVEVLDYANNNLDIDDDLSPHSSRYHHFFSLIYYANSGMPPLQIINQERNSDLKKVRWFTALSLLTIFLGFSMDMYSIYQQQHQNHHTVDNKNKPQIQTKEELTNLFFQVMFMTILLLNMLLFSNLMVINPLRWMQISIRNHYIDVLTPKIEEVQIEYPQRMCDEYQLENQGERQIVEGGSLQTLIKRGVVTDSFLENFCLSDNQWTNLNHRAIETMLLSSQHVIKLSHFLKHVETLSSHQAWVLSHPLVYRALTERIPFNFLSVENNLKCLLVDAKSKTPIDILYQQDARNTIVRAGYLFASFIGSFIAQSSSYLPNGWAIGALLHASLFLSLTALVSASTKLGSYFLPGNGLFKKRTVIQECAFIQNGKHKPEIIEFKLKAKNTILLSKESLRHKHLLEKDSAKEYLLEGDRVDSKAVLYRA